MQRACCGVDGARFRGPAGQNPIDRRAYLGQSQSARRQPLKSDRAPKSAGHDRAENEQCRITVCSALV
jgi:hypothetical protein